MIQLAAAVAGGHGEGAGNDEEVSFCSYCGRISKSSRRVCESCGLGVVLHTDTRVLDTPGAAFVIVDAEGSISAVSAAAERIVGRHEDLVGKPIPSVLMAADGSSALDRLVARAATGVGVPQSLAVARVRGREFQTGLLAIVATCGDPRAALIVLHRQPIPAP